MNNSVTLNKNLVLLARVLERLEHSTQAVDAQQYRSVVNHLASELAIAPQDAGLDAVLQACPSAGVLDSAMAAETAARAAIAKARQS
jgi:hypothetical protein